MQVRSSHVLILSALLHPGFTEHSRFPGMMRGAGVEFGPLVERLLEQAVADV